MTHKNPPSGHSPIHFKHFAIFSAISWTLLVIVSISWNLSQIESQAEYLASKEAHANWNKDQAFRHWAIRHGGLYVRENERTPASPYLSHLPHRDVVTEDGTRLTLMAPASMMRQMTDEFEEMYGVKGRITGQVQLNPNNKPDAWELAALKKFDLGYSEISELTQINGEPYFRLIKPMYMESGCMTCHGHLGFKIGDVRGGVSVSIPLKPYLIAAKSNRDVLATSHGIVWFLGLLGIAIFGYRNQLREREQQKTSKALARTAKEWNYAIDFFEDAIYLIDLDDKVVRVNQAFYKLTGLTPEQTINQDISHIMHPHGEPVPCPVCIARKERRDEIITMEAEHPDNPIGKPVEVMVRVIREDEGKPLGILMGIHDLSRSREAAAVLREREQVISDLLNSTAEGIFGLDMQGNCILANPACAAMLGYNNANEFIGQSMHKLIHHRQSDGTVIAEKNCLIYKSFQTNTEIHCDTEVFWRADGSSFPVEYWAYPVRRDNKITGSVVTFIDISERLKTEQMLRRSQKMDALGQLTGGIAHDFNNQLGVVSGYLEMLEDYTTNNEKTSQWIAASRKATNRCIDLTRQLLNFSRQQQTNIERVDLAEEINQLKEIIQRTVTPAVEVIYDIADDLWPIKTSRGDLEDALLNLVINARDAMPNGGTLIISIHNQALGQNEFNNKQFQSGDYVVVVIGDSGCGIPKEAQERIFDPFFSTKEVGKGTGLGMSMVYGFVKRNHGYINLYSEPGEGTSINMYFPRASTDNARQHKKTQSTNITETRGQNETILIVEDEENLRELACELLSAQGYKILTAENGEAAIEILRSNETVDLLFCDIIMPGGMNGYQVAEKAKALRPSLKIQLTSGLADKSIVNSYTLESEFNILQKPYSRSDLIKCINNYFEA
ncbi:MAG: PAS domain S-box protein [Gammaproteobacteria bacterium]|nr:PAS domain S-box protein [Gammaproteobacteria bacterium]